MINFEQFVGKQVFQILGAEPGSEAMALVFDDDTVLALYHQPDCCESVDIAEIHGDMQDLLGGPLLVAQERTGESESHEFGSQTYTFYEFASIQGSVTIRWVGTSNGYYSERVEVFYAHLSAQRPNELAALGITLMSAHEKLGLRKATRSA